MASSKCIYANNANPYSPATRRLNIFRMSHETLQEYTNEFLPHYNQPTWHTALQNLRDCDLIELYRWQETNGESEQQPLSSIPLKLRSNDVYGLTKTGGRLWVHIVKADWTRYVLQCGFPADSGVEESNTLTSLTLSRLFEYADAIDGISGKIVRRDEPTIINHWEPTYWNSFPIAYQMVIHIEPLMGIPDPTLYENWREVERWYTLPKKFPIEVTCI